jgi:hypothetical protein
MGGRLPGLATKLGGRTMLRRVVGGPARQQMGAWEGAPSVFGVWEC